MVKKPGNFSAEKDMKDVECFKCNKMGHYASKCPKIKAKDTKGAFKVRKVDDSSVKEELEAKSIRQIYIRYSDLNAERQDPFMRYTSVSQCYHMIQNRICKFINCLFVS